MLYTILLILVVVGGITLYWLVTRSRDESRSGIPDSPPAAVSAQELAALAQPYRGLLGEAVAVQQELAGRARGAPETLRHELLEISDRVQRMVQRALPLARHGTQLMDFMLRLTPEDAEYAATKADADRIEDELREKSEQFRRLRGKVYGVLSNAASLSADRQLKSDLSDALSDVTLLEEALDDTLKETALLP